MRFLYGNWFMITSIDYQFVAVDWRFDSIFVKHIPEFLDKLGDAEFQRRGSVSVEYKISMEFLRITSF